MSLTKYEQETILVFNEEEKIADVFTNNKKLKRRLEELLDQYPDDVTFHKDNSAGGVTYYIPKGWIKINPKRILTSEQKQAAASNLKNTTKIKS